MIKKIIVLFVLCLYLTEAQKYNGNAITPQIEMSVTDLLKRGYVLLGEDQMGHVKFIKKSLQNMYGGFWNVVISTRQYQYLNCSVNNQWWMRWYNSNPYLPSWIYSLQRYEEQYSQQNVYTGYGNYSWAFGNGFTSDQIRIMINIVRACEFGNENINWVQNSLNQYIQKGNWTVVRQWQVPYVMEYQPYYSVYGKENKYFMATPLAYTEGGNVYIAYLS